MRQKRIREEPAVRRKQILEEAFRLIGEQGFNGFTIQQLSGRCGMSNAGLLHYFASKDELLAGVLAEIEQRQIAAVTPHVAAIEGRLARGVAGPADIRAFLRAMLDAITADRQFGPFLLVVQAEAIERSHPAHCYFAAAEASAIALFERILRAHSPHPEKRARLIHAAMVGLAQQWHRSGMTLDLAAIWDEALNLLLA